MKAQLIAVVAVCLCITSVLFIDPINSALVATATVQSSGTIIQGQSGSTELTVILRHTGVMSGSVDSINKKVDNFVAAHPYITAITISDMHQYGIWWYGYTFNKENGTWMGVTFNELQAMINRFHYHDWKVGIETTGIAWVGQEEYNYITTQHPELAFTDANGLRATGMDNITAVTKNPGYNKVIPDFFAKFATPDLENNIPVGMRLIDLYTNRLTQMIKDGLQWDFWFGTDGWNGFNLQGYNWNSLTAASCYSFSVTELTDYSNWQGAVLPTNWDPSNNIQMAQKITVNNTILNQWYQFWQIKFAEMYAQIKQAFINAGESANTFHTIGTIDLSTPQQQNLGAAGMYNLTDLANAKSFDYLYTDQEGVSGSYNVGMANSLVAAFAKSLGLAPIIGLQPVDYLQTPDPLWSVEQSYLEQALNYVWINGVRNPVVNPKIIMMQYPNAEGWTGWTSSQIDQLFAFIHSINQMLANAQPVWLGPTYLQTNQMSSSDCISGGFHFSVAQWGLVSNVQNKPAYISPAMNTLILDIEGWRSDGNRLNGLSSQIMDMFNTGQLSLWAYSTAGRDWSIAESVFGDSKAEQLIDQSLGIRYSSYTNVNPANTFTFVDATHAGSVGAQLIQGYENSQYQAYASPNYYSAGMTILANAQNNENRIALGIYNNTNNGKAVYSLNVGEAPSKISNRLLYWVCNSPVISSEPLIDLKIYQNINTIYIPMTNQLDAGLTTNINDVSFALNVDSAALGLGPIGSYKFSWASNPLSTWSESSWNNLQNLTLKEGADILIIKVT